MTDPVDVEPQDVAVEADKPLQSTRPEEVLLTSEKKLPRYAVVMALAKMWRRTRKWPSVACFAYVEQLTHAELMELWERAVKERETQEAGYYSRKRRIAEEVSR